MKIEMWDIAAVKEYERNPRKNDAAIDAVAESIRQFGFKVPVIVDGSGVLVAGHTRIKAAQKLGLKEVPVRLPGARAGALPPVRADFGRRAPGVRAGGLPGRGQG